MEEKKNFRLEKFEYLLVAILLIYPMRHIAWGLDLWDTGYNYANYRFMGLEHMDSMWLFSTYLSNAIGHVMSLLPFGNTLMGMNFYTGLTVSFMAVGAYLFCTRRLNFTKGLTFIAEFAAISLCWCPTALLYNYITYVFLLCCTFFLYEGLIHNKNKYLVVAGIFLGLNIFVRFSDLPEAALILAVWGYGVVEFLCKEKDCIHRTVRRTLYCMLGYIISLGVMFLYIHLRYGMEMYIDGISRLFSMTEDASDYKAASMIYTIVYTYLENMYWVVRILLVVIVLTVGLFLVQRLLSKERNLHSGDSGSFLFKLLSAAVCVIISAAVVVWLYYRSFCSLEFTNYGAIIRPGILFLMLTMLMAVICIFNRKRSRGEWLIAGIVFLTVILTSIGSNNGVYPSINNLFIAAPFTFNEIYLFIKHKDFRLLGAKTVIVGFLLIFMFQSVGFGAGFVFVEATGATDVGETVENNQCLKGIRMSKERARWMSELSAYVNEADLRGEEVVLYGYIPSLSFYLDMPSAFNPWSDLKSYSYDEFNKNISRLQDYPVIIIEDRYAKYIEGDDSVKDLGEDRKWLRLVEYIRDNDYSISFRNDKFAVLER